MAMVKCIELSSAVVLPTSGGQKLAFNKGETLMIVFYDEQDRADYYGCSGGGGLPFVYIDKKSSHKIVEMELAEWQELRQSKQWHKYALPIAVS